MAEAPPPAHVQDWPSYRLWQESDTRRRQHWYVLFCLMMSAVQDRLTGISLREHGNLNWATTAFYYSTVHTGRLCCFAVCGDFPTRHSDLANLFAPPTASDQQIRFDWLDRFRQYVVAPGVAGPIRQSAQRSFVVSELGHWFGATNAPECSELILALSPQIQDLASLRNDCNYESLLIAHERDHPIVSAGFSGLVKSACRVSRLAAELAIRTYLAAIERGSLFEFQRDIYVAAHQRYLRGRFETTLKDKFRDSAQATAELDWAVELLDLEEVLRPEYDLDSFLEPIMYGSFGEKRGLMERWSNDVAALNAEVGHDQNQES